MQGPLMCTSVVLDDPDELVEPDSIAMRYATEADVLIDGGHGGTIGSTIVDLTDSSAPEIVREGVAEFEQ